MLDIKFIREHPDVVKQGCRAKQVEVDIDKLLELDGKKREYLKEIEGLRAEQNKFSQDQIKEAQEIKTKIKKLEPELNKLGRTIDSLMLQIPNLPLAEVPLGEDESNNIELKKEGELPQFNFPVKDYLEIAESLDLIDVKRTAKITGTRFGFLRNEAVLLEFALINLAFDTLTKEGFVPIIPPVMLKPEMAKGMGYPEQFDGEEAYYIEKDNLFLVGTSEQSMGAMHANETFNEKDLPQRYVGFSTCFRREAGSYGKDTKGIFRVHQFDKVEMFSFSKPEDSKKEHQFLLKMEENLMKKLKIPYRILQMCTGDLGFPAAAKYDIETWMPSESRYRETHSTSNCTDFQSRRLNIRYKKKDGSLDFVHTLNGTAFATGRTIIAIIENYQQKDGSVKMPEALQKYLKFKIIK